MSSQKVRIALYNQITPFYLEQGQCSVLSDHVVTVISKSLFTGSFHFGNYWYIIHRLKCNREKPCQNCIVRGEAIAASCTYAEKAEKKHGQFNIRSDEDMRKRLNRLENSILSMMSNESDRTGSQTDSTSDQGPENMVEGPSQSQRISADTRSTHWDAILNDVSNRP